MAGLRANKDDLAPCQLTTPARLLRARANQDFVISFYHVSLGSNVTAPCLFTQYTALFTFHLPLSERRRCLGDGLPPPAQQLAQEKIQPSGERTGQLSFVAQPFSKLWDVLIIVFMEDDFLSSTEYTAGYRRLIVSTSRTKTSQQHSLCMRILAFVSSTPPPSNLNLSEYDNRT